MSENKTKIVKSLVIFGLIVLAVNLSVVAYIRYTQINNARRACERAKLDRADNALGWRIAEEARRDSGETDVADSYDQIADSLEKRSKIDCDETYKYIGGVL